MTLSQTSISEQPSFQQWIGDVNNIKRIGKFLRRQSQLQSVEHLVLMLHFIIKQGRYRVRDARYLLAYAIKDPKMRLGVVDRLSNRLQVPVEYLL